MKTALVNFARPSFFALLLLLATQAFSQKTTTWQGGTPGRENHWDCPSNWSTNTVPNEFSDVVIPDVSTSTQKYPIINEEEVEIKSIEVQSGASLILSRTARIVTEVFACYGSCKGCDQRVLIEGNIPPVMASRQ